MNNRIHTILFPVFIKHYRSGSYNTVYGMHALFRVFMHCLLCLNRVFQNKRSQRKKFLKIVE